MSIIYEALQKIERKPAYSRPPAKLKPEPKRKQNKAPVPILLVAFATMAIILYPQIKKIMEGHSAFDTSSNTSIPATQQPKPPEKALNLSLPRLSFTQPESKNKKSSHNTQVADGLEFTLSGIIYAKSKYMAIINGRGIAKGDTVENAVVSDINDKSVVLMLNDKKITLYLY